ncbi:Glutamyl aminopeptidase [Streptococcus thermophilus CNCM I-1630]|nr:Glutamyl aminopeptidase [Streptococcus thermophilus CNCM I-1630]
MQTDGLGGTHGIKHSQTENAPKVLVAAHMDEVGFMIKEIKADVDFPVLVDAWVVVTPTEFVMFFQRLIPLHTSLTGRYSIPCSFFRVLSSPTLHYSYAG